MSGDFLDSNVFVYLFDETDDRKRTIADGIVQSGLQSHSATISFQVVQETLNVLTRKLPDSMASEDARLFLQNILTPLWKVFPTPALYQRAIDVQGRYRFSFYDSLIVASALDAGCETLYTEDLQHGQCIEGLTIENPFLEA